MITMKPDALFMLEEELGQQAAAEAIGVSSGVFTTAHRDGAVRKAYEMAAEMALGDREEIQYICTIPMEQDDLFQTFMKGLKVMPVKIS